MLVLTVGNDQQLLFFRNVSLYGQLKLNYFLKDCIKQYDYRPIILFLISNKHIYINIYM